MSEAAATLSEARRPAPPPAANDALMVLRGVTKTYGGRGGEVVALSSIDLDVRRGEFLTIIGPSGCGKSTLLQIAAGLVPATSGSITLEGRPVTAPPRGIVYLFQQYNKSLFPWRSVRSNVAFALAGKGLDRHQRAKRAQSFLALVGLEAFGNHYPWQLSGGMQQRVAIARALAAEPAALLMDEPFSAVDALTRVEMQALLLDIWRQRAGLTIILVTHDVEEAVYLSDRIAVMGRRPATVERVLETGLPRPRDPVATREDPVFLRHRGELLDDLLGRGLVRR
ncbi:ABC transporter ATP-binding protein [Roseomonas sp. BN140053]|uniref:ABC transporter ATP-binding protein n=1 Tax=Roseomonas sp. BN140053 TaxID=3391898 RepID=UPI0039EC6751